jgi:hypothetical protein
MPQLVTYRVQLLAIPIQLADVLPRELAGCAFQRRNSRAFDTTLTLLNAITAPAITGFR